MRITVIGCGRWGSCIAWYLATTGHEVTLYGRPGSRHMQQFIEERKNEYLTLPASVRLSTSLASVKEAECVAVSVNAQGLRALMSELAALGLENTPFVLCMKGIEIETGKRLSEIAEEYLPADCPVAVWLGPGHVQEFTRGVPNCMVIDSRHEALKDRLIKAFSSPLIRFYYGRDLIGSETGAAAKNVIGLAAGMLDGLGLGTLKGALMARGTREVARLIEALGGNGLSAYGLCHLGDYEATVFSPYSHNRRCGEAFVKGEPFGSLAEGCHTVRALMRLKEQYGLEMPISETVYAILYGHAAPREAVFALFDRSLKNEF